MARPVNNGEKFGDDLNKAGKLEKKGSYLGIS